MSQKMGKRRRQQMARVDSVNPWNSLDIMRDHLWPYERQIALDVAEIIAETPAGSVPRAHDSNRLMASRLADVMAHQVAGRSRQYMPWDGRRRPFDPAELPEACTLSPDPFFEECYLQAVNLNVCGARVMHVGEGLVQQMAATQSNAPCGEFRLPFNAFVLTTRSETMIRLFLEGTDASYTPEMSLSIVVAVAIDSEGARRLSLFSHAIRGRTLIKCTVARIQLESRTVRDSVAAFLSLGRNQPTMITPSGAPAARPDNWFGEHGESYYLTLTNVLLYLTMPTARLRDTTVRAEIDDDSRETRQVVVCGEDEKAIIFDPVRLVKALGKGRSKDPEFTIDARIMVRGHWRARKGQAALPEPERQWIRPYWKGLDSPSKPQRHYDVRAGGVS
jgi:hypothetical protein